MGWTSRSLSIRCSASVKRSVIVCIGPPVLWRGRSGSLYPLQGPSPVPSGQPAAVVVAAAPAERLGEQHRTPGADDPDRPEVVELAGADHRGEPDGEHDDGGHGPVAPRSEEHTSELQSRQYPVCRLLLEKKKYYT